MEGATIGASIASVIPVLGASQIVGAGIGALVGLRIQGIKAWKPKFFDDPVTETKKMIDGADKGLKGFGGARSKGVGGIGKAF